MNTRWYYLVLLTIVIILIAVIYTILIARMGLLPLDLPTTLTLQSIPGEWFSYLMYIASIPGWYPWNIITVLIGSIIAGKIWSVRIGVYLLVITSLQAPLNSLIKYLVARPRPSEPLVDVVRAESGYSFPSGHVMFYTIFFGFLMYMVIRYMPRGPKKSISFVLLGTIIVLVGISRIYLGAHWFSDVVAGYMVGLVFLAWAIEIIRSSLTGDVKIRGKFMTPSNYANARK